MAAKVKVIPASKSGFYSASPIPTRKRRVAGYARVSTDKEEQATSYEVQLEYYTSYIKSNASWEFAGMYSDEGISATSTARREGFNQMISDALSGKIDLIITKSVSRFARNTVDSLTAVRKLKEKGVEVYFEKENIYTLDSKGELLITIMSSLAQEESRSISENTKWGKRKRFAEGEGCSVAYSCFLGYDKDFVINKKEAKTVKLIYDLFLSGWGTGKIAKELMNRGLKTATGGDRWWPGTVKNILTNEKYKGDLLLQKTYTKDFLTHEIVKNDGSVPQYYVKGHHEAIISPEQFDLAQIEMRKREEARENGNLYSSANPFSSKIKCGHCGSFYGPKVLHSNDKYRRIVYNCNHKYHNKTGEVCRTPYVTETEIKEIFVKALNSLLKEKEDFIVHMKEEMDALGRKGELEKQQQEELRRELEETAESAKKYVMENAHTAIDQEEYAREYNSLVERCREQEAELDKISESMIEEEMRVKRIEYFIKQIKDLDPITEFDEKLWVSLVDFVTVYGKGDIRVMFKNGMEVKEAVAKEKD